MFELIYPDNKNVLFLRKKKKSLEKSLQMASKGIKELVAYNI